MDYWVCTKQCKGGNKEFLKLTQYNPQKPCFIYPEIYLFPILQFISFSDTLW